MWECPDRGTQQYLTPLNTVEKALTIQMAEAPEEPPPRSTSCNAATTDLIRKSIRDCLWIATDGGATGTADCKDPAFRIAGWGMSTNAGSTGGPVGGTDISAFESEAEALLQTLRAAQEVATTDRADGIPKERITILTDNWAVVQQAGTAIGTGRLPANVPGIWAEVRLLARHASDLHVTWIPPHRKYMEPWQPPKGISSVDARLLNDEAGRHTSYCGRQGARNL